MYDILYIQIVGRPFEDLLALSLFTSGGGDLRALCL